MNSSWESIVDCSLRRIPSWNQQLTLLHLVLQTMRIVQDTRIVWHRFNRFRLFSTAKRPRKRLPGHFLRVFDRIKSIRRRQIFALGDIPRFIHEAHICVAVVREPRCRLAPEHAIKCFDHRHVGVAVVVARADIVVDVLHVAQAHFRELFGRQPFAENIGK